MELRRTSTLTAGPAGSMFGTTIEGGANGLGTVFELSPTAHGFREKVLYSFQKAGSGDGIEPLAGVIRDGSGALYGTTETGGSRNYGIVYKLTPHGSRYVETILHNFGTSGDDGGVPYDSLIEDGQGNLYGTTFEGGGTGSQECFDSCGTVFKLAPSGSGYVESILYGFKGGKDGASPYAGLVADAHGDLFGTTLYGGGSPSTSYGTVFELVPSASTYTEKVLYRFAGAPADGANPYAGLVLDAKGNLFGTTLSGGSGTCSFGSAGPGCGTVYELSRTGSVYSERVIHDFTGDPDGDAPYAAPILRKDGSLVGTTTAGGDVCWAGCGTVFSLTPMGKRYAERILYMFKDGKNGGYPYGGLLAGAANTLFGTTLEGGNEAGHCLETGCGTVFQITL